MYYRGYFEDGKTVNDPLSYHREFLQTVLFSSEKKNIIEAGKIQLHAALHAVSRAVCMPLPFLDNRSDDHQG